NEAPARPGGNAQGQATSRRRAGSRRLLAGGDLRRVGPLADLVLGRVPASRDDLVEGLLGDRRRLQDDGLDLVVARGGEVLGGVARGRRDGGVDVDRDLAHVLVLAQLDGGLAGGLAELVAVLPDIHVLLAERNVVEVRRVAILAAQRRVWVV